MSLLLHRCQAAGQLTAAECRAHSRGMGELSQGWG